MIRRSTWILLIVFFIALGVLIYLERNPLSTGEKTPTTTPAPVLLNDWKFEDVISLQYKNNKGISFTLSKQADKTWKYIAERELPANENIVRSTISSILGLNVAASLPLNFQLDTVGLVMPASTIMLTDTQNRQATIQIGNMTPTENGYYLKVNNAPPVVVNKYALDEVFTLLSPSNFIELTPTPSVTPTTNP
ncbi:MAG TPA: DUF4340 domain-containing protein [Anaerolineaceae bacterium]